MNTKQKVIGSLVLVAMIFGCGMYAGFRLGHSTSPKGVHSVFTPYQDGTRAYLEFLDKTETGDTVLAGDYGFTQPLVVDKYIELHDKRKAHVAVVLDKSQTEASAAEKEEALIKRLTDAGIEVVVGNSPKAGEIMHNKFTVIGKPGNWRWVEDGSWNYTPNADDQANVLNFDYDHPARASCFAKVWTKLHDHIVNPPPLKGKGAKKQAQDLFARDAAEVAACSAAQ